MSFVLHSLTLFASVFHAFAISHTSPALGQFLYGGSISLRAVPNSDEVQITVTVACKRSFSEQLFCNDTTRGSILKLNIILEVSNRCLNRRRSVSNHTLSFRCMDFSVVNDWTIAIGEANIFKHCNSTFLVAAIPFENGTWIETINGLDVMHLLMGVNMTKRDDLNRINTSPTTALPPLIRLLYGCEHTIKIPVVDEDGDKIRCKLIFPWESCLGNCTEISTFSLNEDTCTLHQSNDKRDYPRPGLYTVVVSIEDVVRYNETSFYPYSQSVVFFIVEIFHANAACTDEPVITDAKHANEGKINVPIGQTLKEQIVATATSSTQSIVAIETISLPGMKKGPLLPYTADPSGRSKFVVITWNPTEEQRGKHLLCFVAVTDIHLSSKPLCRELDVGVAPKKGDDPETEKDDEPFWKSNVFIAAVVGGVFAIVAALIGVYCIKRRQST